MGLQLMGRVRQLYLNPPLCYTFFTITLTPLKIQLRSCKIWYEITAYFATEGGGKKNKKKWRRDWCQWHIWERMICFDSTLYLQSLSPGRLCWDEFGIKFTWVRQTGNNSGTFFLFWQHRKWQRIQSTHPNLYPRNLIRENYSCLPRIIAALCCDGC